MQTTAKKTHPRLVYAREQSPARDRLRELADAYLEAFRETLAEFLAFEKIGAVGVESALGAVHGRPCLRILIREPGRDPVINTKIFAAANATATYLGVHWDELAVDATLTWAEVAIETAFAAAERSAFGSRTGRLRAI